MEGVALGRSMEKGLLRRSLLREGLMIKGLN